MFLVKYYIDIENSKMADISSDYMKSDGKSASSIGIIGYTGETGKELAKQILKLKIFKSVTLIGRRNVDYTEEFYKNGVN